MSRQPRKRVCRSVSDLQPAPKPDCGQARRLSLHSPPPSTGLQTCLCGPGETLLRKKTSYVCLAPGAQHWLCENCINQHTNRCRKHNTAAVFAGNLFCHTVGVCATPSEGRRCSYGCINVLDDPHHCPRLKKKKIVHETQVYPGLREVARSAGAVVFGSQGPVVALRYSGQYGNARQIVVVKPSHTAWQVLSCTTEHPLGAPITQYAVVLPNVRAGTFVDLYPTIASPLPCVSKQTLACVDTAIHSPSDGWPTMNGWHLKVLEAVYQSGCASKRWTCLTGKEPFSGRAFGGGTVVELRQRFFFTACGAKAAYVKNQSGGCRCCWCGHSFSSLARYYSSCAPELSTSCSIGSTQH